jgi:hypothetical protein
MMKCPFCQFENEDGALFCEQCKSDLGGAQPIAVAQEEPAQQAAPVAQGSESPPIAAVVVGEEAMAGNVPVAEVPAEDIHSARTLPPDAIPVAPAGRLESETLHYTETPTAPPAEPAPAAAPAEKLPEGSKPHLVVIRGQRINAEYPIYEGDNYIGRADDKAVDIDLEDQESPERVWSSRQHALLTFESGQLAIQDLNSTNGTFVNRTRVHPGEKRPLQVNDVIQVGTVQMRVIV